MNKQKILSYHFWKEYQGEEGEQRLGVIEEGNKTYSIFKKIPEQNLYHITIILFGKDIDIIYKKGSKEGSIVKRRWA
jgi:hypothetical protein